MMHTVISKNWSSHLLLVVFIYQQITVGEAGACTDCSNILLGTESKNFTYGPSDEYNCNCQWTIPTRKSTDGNTAVVLLLQNISLPMTSGSGGSIDCSGKIRFPGFSRYECNIAKYCLITFATGSTTCNVTKITENLLVSEKDCISITTSKTDTQKILYTGENSAGYTKYFAIEYLLLDCRDSAITTEASTQPTTNTKATHQYEENSTIIHTDKNLASSRYIATITRNSEQRSTESKLFINSTTIIIIAASAAGLFLLILFAVLLSIRAKTKETECSKKNEDKNDPNEVQETVENSIYGATTSDHKSETIINGIYDATPVTEVTNDKPCLYATVGMKTGDKKQDGDKNVETEENIVIIEDESSSVYAVVNKGKK